MAETAKLSKTKTFGPNKCDIFPIRVASVFLSILARFGTGNALSNKNGQKLEKRKRFCLKTAQCFQYVLLVFWRFLFYNIQNVKFDIKIDSMSYLRNPSDHYSMSYRRKTISVPGSQCYRGKTTLSPMIQWQISLKCMHKIWRKSDGNPPTRVIWRTAQDRICIIQPYNSPLPKFSTQSKTIWIAFGRPAVAAFDDLSCWGWVLMLRQNADADS